MDVYLASTNYTEQRTGRSWLMVLQMLSCRHTLMPFGKRTLEAILEEAKAKKGDIFDKGVIFLKGIIQRHPFESGNRRTAVVVTASFSEINGERLNITHDVSILQGIREEYYTNDEIKKWFKGGGIRDFKRFY